MSTLNPNLTTFNVLDIRRGTTVDGPGLRTSIYLAGCRHACPGCHNPDSWDFNAGTPMTVDEILEVVREEDFDVTLTGGDPLMHPHTLPLLTAAIRSLGKSIWLYTGYTISQIRLNPALRRAVADIDTIVEGPFILALRDTDLIFRGSANQRIIHLR
ncbi:MAG: anaerobic ribonucleoside-triphosphate reductase activating protein [Muribaculaceae bacterium]|nr:anaerobic ribonucleoside-triphosphate reductase activating protein [Muribaculaceae bacterium]